ncbi:hypothetical protein BU14_0634s0007 [Porphyra umbilicalis]|uniref:Uncharacterized protein n=1 Tax=Porphyra umbilicalis TaxID=2786 RepID=A0A1X6NQM6_PORUM|nr:hypothetical protein BU14_0634s0007 [Porphyra umbilicalis]|eukprot:OSX70921.1 hypothetical protein BU14_0634s0007 [Porphyra umbilicalis]
MMGRRTDVFRAADAGGCAFRRTALGGGGAPPRVRGGGGRAGGAAVNSCVCLCRVRVCVWTAVGL